MSKKSKKKKKAKNETKELVITNFQLFTIDSQETCQVGINTGSIYQYIKIDAKK